MTISWDSFQAFFDFIKYDANAPALGRWLEAKPWLASLRNPEGFGTTQLASSACRKIIARCLYFAARFELHDSSSPEHKSDTSVVRRVLLVTIRFPLSF